MPKVACFDFDDVLTDKDTLSKFMSIFGHTFGEMKYGIELLEDNKNPKKFFKTVKKIVALGKGIKYSRVEKIAYLLKPSKNALLTLKTLKQKGYKIVIVSVNDESLIKKFLKKSRLDIYVDHVYAAKLGVKNNLLTGEITGDVVKTEKVGVVSKIEKIYKAKKSDIAYVGDGLTDLPIMKKVGVGILFNPNPLSHAEALADKDLAKMKRSGRLFLVKEKNLEKVLEFL